MAFCSVGASTEIDYNEIFQPVEYSNENNEGKKQMGGGIGK